MILGIGGAPVIGQVAINTGEKWFMLVTAVMLLIGSIVALWRNRPTEWRRISNWFKAN